jgi:hypothetical protein
MTLFRTTPLTFLFEVSLCNSNVNVVICLSHIWPSVSSVGVAVAVWEVYRDARLVSYEIALLAQPTTNCEFEGCDGRVRSVPHVLLVLWSLRGSVLHHRSMPVSRMAILLVVAEAGS